MNRTKLAIIGCGIITEEAHLPALKRLQDRIEIKAVCNRTRSKAENIAGKLGLSGETVWTDWEQMIKEAEDFQEIDSIAAVSQSSFSP